MDPFDRDRIQVDAVQAAYVDTPSGEFTYALRDLSGSSMTRLPERKNATCRAEVVLGGAGVPLVEREVFERREKPKALRVHTMDESTSPAADRAVTRSDVIEIEVYLEANAATVARAAICLHATHVPVVR